MRQTATLLASDLDGTLLPVDPDPTHAEGVARLRDLVADAPDLHLAYVTGRGPDEALEGVRTAGLPRPDALVCDVGTRILHRDGDAWRRDEPYHAAVLAALAPADADAVRETVLALGDFELQSPARQTPVKMSFRLHGEDWEPALERVRSRLRERGWTLAIVSSRCVFSGDVLLDVLPGGVDKAAAVHHLRKELGLDPPQVIFAGDSGNDLAPLTAGFRALIVGNAAPGLADRVREFAAREGWSERVHAASRPHVHGVLEGLRRFGIVSRHE